METVVVRTTQKEDDSDRFIVLEQVLEESGFWKKLEENLAGSGKTRKDFLIAVKPNLMMFYSRNDRSVFTDPALVEYLINRMAERGYSNIALVESQNVFGNWFNKREVDNVARIAGYNPSNYRITDLTLDAVSHTYSGSLGTNLVGKTWRDADFRISFAKNKTHFFCYYSLTVKNIYGTAPEQNKFLEYHKDREAASVTVEMLNEFPVQFGIVDAIWSADGLMGVKADLTPKHTKTIIAGSSLVAVDMVGAQKMGLDPMKSIFVKLAAGACKPQIHVSGDTSVYGDWDNVPPGLDMLMDYAEEWYDLSNQIGFISSEMDEAFPQKPISWISRALRRITLRIMKFISLHE